MPGGWRAALLAGAIAIGISACGSGGDDSPEPNDGTAIVAIGDSVASGEGNPASKGPRWIDKRCHRSETAGVTFAAEQAIQGHPEIGYFNFSCSGASIQKGILGPYKGIEPSLIQPARAQILQVQDVQSVSRGGLAAVLVSVGANDVGFTKVVKFCAVVPKCWTQHFNPDNPLFEAGPKAPTLEEWVADQLDDLPSKYTDLATALEPLVDSDRVIISEYFDPTTAADGSDCTMLFGGIKPDESRWAREHVLIPLNQQIADAAEEHGWQLVPGVDEAFKGHGLCAGRQRWVRTLGEGLTGNPLPLGGVFGIPDIRGVVASSTGTLHPNEKGHRQIAVLISPVLAETLNPPQD